MGLRRESREIAIQTLYALYIDAPKDLQNSSDASVFINDKLAQVIATVDKTFSLSQREFSYFLVENTYKHIETIDKLIKQFSEHWDFNRISIIDKSILRMSIMEMEFTETAGKIIINEAIEIAKKFSGEKSGKFINGILDAVMHRKDKNDRM